MPIEQHPEEPLISAANSDDSNMKQETSRPTVRMGSSSAYQLAAQMFALGVNFVVSVLVARTLGPAGKGELSILQQIPATLAILLSAGVSYSNLYFVGTRRHSPGMALGNSLTLALAAGVVGAPIIWLTTIGPLAIVDGLPLLGASIAAVILPVTLAGSFVVSIAHGLGLLKKASIASMLATVATLVLIAFTFALGGLNVTAVLAISVASALTSMAFVMNAMRPHLEVLAVRLSAFRESWTYSAKSYLGTLAGYINYRADILMLGYLVDARTVGIYSIAVTFAELMWYVPNALATSILSKSMSLGEVDGTELTARTARITSLLMLVVCAAAAALIGPIIGIFYGGAFAPAVIPFMALLPGIWLMGIAKILSGYLNARGKIYPGLSAMAAAVNIAANLLLIPTHGAMGAAVASTISYVMLAVTMAVAYRSQSGTRLRHLLLPNSDDMESLYVAAANYARAVIRKSG